MPTRLATGSVLSTADALFTAISVRCVNCVNFPYSRQHLMDNIESAIIIAAQGLLTNSAPDHASCVIAASVNRLTSYIAGYVARKCILKTGCEECLKLLMQKKSPEKS